MLNLALVAAYLLFAAAINIGWVVFLIKSGRS